MDYTKVLCANEWSKFLRNDVQLPIVAHDQIENLAKKLARRSRTIHHFIQLTERQLEREYQFDRQGLLNRIKKWQSTASTNFRSIEAASSMPTHIDHPPSPTTKLNPLVAVICFIMTDINNEHVRSGLESAANGGDGVTYEMIENYRRIVAVCKRQCEQTTDEEDMITMTCRGHGKTYQLPKKMRFLALMPVCFQCQEDWINSFYRKHAMK